jgi:uncharacterized membrane protein
MTTNQGSPAKAAIPVTDSAASGVASPTIHPGALTAIGVLVVAYAALSYYSDSSAHAQSLGAALSIGPVLLIGLALLWRWTKPLTTLLAAALLGACLFRYWGEIEKNYRWADLAQQCGIYGLIALSFARSLFGGRVPLCTQLAMQMHGALTPVEAAYTKRATAAWAIFYLLLAAAIATIFFAAARSVWSFFVNFATFGLIIIMAVADHGLRRRLLPRHPAGGMLGIMRKAIIG